MYDYIFKSLLGLMEAVEFLNYMDITYSLNSYDRKITVQDNLNSNEKMMLSGMARK